jgi:hypothetical protein
LQLGEMRTDLTANPEGKVPFDKFTEVAEDVFMGRYR